MSWIEVCLHGTQEAVDWVNTLLSTVNYQGDVQITNYSITSHNEPEHQHFADRSAEAAPWQFTICLYFPNTATAGAQVEEIERLFSPLHRTGLTTLPQITVLAEKPDGHARESYRIGQRFVVLAADCVDRLQPPDIPLHLAATRAFGSGLHPTTIISLKLLERYVLPGMQTLDLGCGSGILSVGMAKLGATVLALDNDAVAVAAAQDAVARNGIQSQVTVAQGSLGAGSELGHWMGEALSDPVPAIDSNARFDLVVANILARIHLALVEDYSNALRRPGFLIAAGFTSDYEIDISTAVTDAGFEAIDREQLNEWVGFAYRLNAPAPQG